MKSYIGTKILQAEPMTRGDFWELMKIPADPQRDPNTAGYYLNYPDGYQSWSPKEVFENAYRPFGGLKPPISRRRTRAAPARMPARRRVGRRRTNFAHRTVHNFLDTLWNRCHT